MKVFAGEKDSTVFEGSEERKVVRHDSLALQVCGCMKLQDR